MAHSLYTNDPVKCEMIFPDNFTKVHNTPTVLLTPTSPQHQRFLSIRNEIVPKHEEASALH